MGKLYNRARMTVSGTPGTGTITLGSAVSGFQSFASAGVANGDVVSYLIEDGTNWEIGQGTYTSSGTTLARTTVQGSSNSGSAISATSSAIICITALADDIATAVTTWTPVLKFGGATTGITYSTQTGNIITLGNGKLVFAQLHLTLTSKGSATGTATITGLSANTTALAGSVLWTFYDHMSGMTLPAGYVSPSGTTIQLLGSSSAAVTNNLVLTDANFTNTSDIYITVTYIAA